MKSTMNRPIRILNTSHTKPGMSGLNAYHITPGMKAGTDQQPKDQPDENA